LGIENLWLKSMEVLFADPSGVGTWEPGDWLSSRAVELLSLLAEREVGTMQRRVPAGYYYCV
jgi:hypothetical protein